MPSQVPRRTPASFPTNIQEDAFSGLSASPRDLSPLVSGMMEIVTALASLTTDQSGPDETFGPPDGSYNRNTKGIEQLVLLRFKEAPSSPSGDIQDIVQSEYQYRPMAQGEEEIMRIYVDKIYGSPDMTEKPGGLHIEGYIIRDGQSCSLQAAPHHPVMEAYSDLELEGLLRDTPCFEIRHLIYFHFTIYNMYNCCTHARMYAWILSIASVRPKPTMDADVNLL